MINKIILDSFPTIRHPFTKKTYFYIALVFLLFQYYLYKKEQYVLISFIALGIIGYLLLSENTTINKEETLDFGTLEKRMDDLMNNRYFKIKKNYMYVNLGLLDFLYSIRGFRMVSIHYFNRVLLRINIFLRIYEEIHEKKHANTIQLEKLVVLKKDILNLFHSIVFKLQFEDEIKKHNEFRYILDEKLNDLLLHCLQYGRGHINLNNFAYDPYFRKGYDIY